jgi:hypothetical protein
MSTHAPDAVTPSTIEPPAETAPSMGDEPVHDAEAAASASPLDDAAAERRRLEAELAAIERRREEVARALIVNAHPELADPIRVLTGRLYAVARVEERMREPLSKGEVRKLESLGTKRESLHLRRAELDAKRAEVEAEIATVDHELAQLGELRTKGFERDRGAALEQLVVSLVQLGPTFDAAGVDPANLVDGLAVRMSDVKATAEALASRASA